MPETRVALVTGAARGIGQAIAVRIAEPGRHVIAVDQRPADGTASQIKEAGSEATAITSDLSSPAEIEQLVSEVNGSFGRVDILVNNAGLMLFRPFSELDLATWRKIQAVNIDAAFQLCSAFTPGMIERGYGRIVNTSSNTAWKPPGAGFVAYIASKGAVVGFTRALAVELGQHGITVNSIAPGLTKSPGALEGNTDEHFDAVRLAQAIKRNTVPADMAGAVAFLISDEAAMITGQTIRIDGGLVTI